MKVGLSALDINICVDELKENVLDAWVGKIYEIDGLFLFKLNTPEDVDRNLVIEPGSRINSTSLKFSTPKKPSSFAMLLRKHISDKKLKKIGQPDFERIVKLKFDRNDETRLLFCELFGEGNLVLCKEDLEIIQPYQTKDWKDRKIRTGEKYALPPKRGRNITEVKKSDIETILEDSPDLVRGLARNLAIGGDLAEEICARAELDKEADPDSLSESEIERIFSIIRDLLDADISPRIIYEDDEPVEVLPFEFQTKAGENVKRFDSYNRALDQFFHEYSKQEVEEERDKELEEEINKVEDRLESQKKNLENLKKKKKEAKRKADAISQYHEEIDYVLERINEIREKEGWEKIEKILENPEDYDEKWANSVKNVSPDEARLALKTPEEKVELDIRLSSFENASKFYEKNKKMKKKIKGVKKAITETEEELRELREEGVKTTPELVTEKTREKRWFEKYRWFYSSQNLLVIAGRDKNTNQEVVEKHMKEGDHYFHADLEGAPHVVVKSGDGEISEKTIEETSIFAAIHSRAWSKGFGNANVYWVEPNQVTEEAPAGKYLPKGSYMIEGERNYQTVPLEAAIGLIEKDETKIPMCGPPSAVESHSNFMIRLKPGKTKKSDLAKKIKNRMTDETEGEININELIRILPPGPGLILD